MKNFCPVVSICVDIQNMEGCPNPVNMSLY